MKIWTLVLKRIVANQVCWNFIFLGPRLRRWTLAQVPHGGEAGERKKRNILPPQKKQTH